MTCSVASASIIWASAAFTSNVRLRKWNTTMYTEMGLNRRHRNDEVSQLLGGTAAQRAQTAGEAMWPWSPAVVYCITATNANTTATPFHQSVRTTCSGWAVWVVMRGLCWREVESPSVAKPGTRLLRMNTIQSTGLPKQATSALQQRLFLWGYAYLLVLVDPHWPLTIHPKCTTGLTSSNPTLSDAVQLS